MSLLNTFMNSNIRALTKKSKSLTKPKKVEKNPTISSRPTSESSSIVSDSIVFSEKWKQTPYTLNGTIVYIVMVNELGQFIRPFEASDFGHLRQRKSSFKKWMISSPENSRNLYAVVVNSDFKILDGVRAQ
ncbi:hypothetical protein KM1_011860 [Entamoeba histolytica HM-3:IMSS]|nr:hypothetical protein KM1_011860 [Entamoeba histolytica HM-3:IMSS]GAT95428.1 hypothetical protein CL6EHI_158070 [Entamoeba histolytica]